MWIRKFSWIRDLIYEDKSKEKILMKVNKGWLVERKCKNELWTDKGR